MNMDSPKLALAAEYWRAMSQELPDFQPTGHVDRDGLTPA
jgi:hypothetical protein